jgi:hypothetical protein
MGVIDSARVVDILALQQLVAEYCAELDTTYGVNSPQFYTEDGVVAIGNMSFRGHEAMRAFYTELAEQNGVRTTRHCFTNLRIAFDSETTATVALILIEFSGPGAPPLLDAANPTIVSDARLRCRLEADGQWRISELTGQPLFAGNDPVLRKLLVS